MTQAQTPQEGYTVTIPGKLADYRLTIPGRLPGLNEYTETTRRNRYQGAQMKKTSQHTVLWCIKSQLRNRPIKKPVFLLFTFYERDRRRDHDNVSSFARKVIQDALVTAGVLHDDGWNYITGYLDQFQVDAKHPRITVEFIEQEEAIQKCKKRQSKNSGK